MAMALLKSLWESGALVFRNRSTDAQVASLSTSGLTVTSLTATGTTLLTATNLRLGTVTQSTIASGVLTVPAGVTYVLAISESGTADQVDTITKSDAADGDILVIIPKNTDTITFDDANIDLGAATRAVAPGGVIVLLYNALAVGAASWQEVLFLAASDNA
jgi:hypothetical protein